MTDASFARALAAARRVLATAPAGLLTDLDGTLAPIVTDPHTARLADGAAEVLAALVTRLAVVAVVTGRAAADARRMVGLPSVMVVGNHGVEWLLPGTDAPSIAPQLLDAPSSLGRMLASVPVERGVTVDDKRYSATVHYRRAADPAAARERILAALRAAAPSTGDHRIELSEGRMSVELRAAGAGDKGTALRDLVDRYALRGIVVLGDDITDLDMFRAAIELRSSGELDAAIIAVGGSASGEVPASVLATADEVLAGPDEAVRLLGAALD